MNKKAWTISWAEMIGLVLVVFVLVSFCQSDTYASIKKTIIKETDAREKEQLDNLVKHINAIMPEIRVKDSYEENYPIDILDPDAKKEYFLAPYNCKSVKEGRCDKDKTKLCLKIRIVSETGGVREHCSEKRLDFLFDGGPYKISSKNLVIKWENNRLSLSSS